MIQVDVKRDGSGRIQSFQMSGHADFDESGKDLVCAGASAVSFGSLNAVMLLTDVELDIEQGEDGGFLSCHVPEKLDADVSKHVQLLLEGMIVSLQTIEESYGAFIQINFL